MSSNCSICNPNSANYNETLVIKQSEITELSKDNSRLATELSEIRKQLHREQQHLQEQATHAGEKELWLTDQCAELTRQTNHYQDELVNDLP